MKLSAFPSHRLATDIFLKADGAVLDQTPLSDAQLDKLYDDAQVKVEKAKKRMSDWIDSLGDGSFAKDDDQVFHRSTKRRPSVDPDLHEWFNDLFTDPPQDHVFPQDRYVHDPPKTCWTELEFSDSGCNISTIYDSMTIRFCYSDSF